MLKRLSSMVAKYTLVVMLALGAVGALSVPVSAGPATPAPVDCTTGGIGIKSGKDCAQGTGTRTNLFGGTNSLFQVVTNVLLFLIGAISVIMLIIGGFRYVLSGGDSTQVTNAKNTILYAVIGIIVALLAYAIVNFVVSSFIAKPTTPTAERTAS